MTKAALVLQDVVYQYATGFSLQIDYLSLQQQQITFLLGKNGSGKSTLAKLAAGIYRPQQGSIFFEDSKINDWSLGAIGAKIGYLWQNPQLQLFAPTVWEEMTFLGTLQGEEPQHLAHQAEYWLEKLAIGSLKNSPVSFLSRGEQQRLALATVLSAGSRYLLLDEPTTALDEERKQSLIQLLKKLAAEGVGMCIISHDRELIAQLAQKKIQLVQGRIADDTCQKGSSC